MANILIKQGKEIAGSNLVTPSSKADKTDLSSIIQTGTTSSQSISAGTYFYLNGTLVRAKVDIANGATFTLNTNYEVVTAGGLNDLYNYVTKNGVSSTYTELVAGSEYTCTSDGYFYLYATATSNRYAYGYVNNVLLFSATTSVASNSLGYTINSIFVRKGSKIKYVRDSSNTALGRFYPV